jgi:hypothetical protein
LTFTLGQEEYGVEILKIQEIKGYSAVTPLPNAPTYVKGVLILRGTIVPIVDLRKKFNLPEAEYTPFTVKFAVSSNLVDWVKLPNAVFGSDRYAACPCIRHDGCWYYLLYLEHRTPRWFFETWIARSRDLKSSEVSQANPVLAPGLADGINASDPDLVEYEGRTFVYYSVGDQQTWSKLRRAVYTGQMSQFFRNCFPR